MHTTAPSPRLDTLLLGLNAFVAVSAIAGGGALVLRPGGELLGLSPDLLTGSPFDTYRVPGVILALVVGVTALAAAVYQRRRSAWAAPASLVAGAVLTGWIGIQVLMLGPIFWLQALLGAVGLAQLGLATWALVRPRPQTPMGERATRLLTHRRLAFVGLSTQEKDFSRMVATELRARGYTLVPIHPSAAEIAGMTSYPSLSAVPEPPRAALVMVPASAASAVVEDAIRAGVEAIWFHRGAGLPGSASPEAVARAEAAGLLVVSDLCPMMFLGHTSAFHRAHAWLREREIEGGDASAA